MQLSPPVKSGGYIGLLSLCVLPPICACIHLFHSAHFLSKLSLISFQILYIHLFSSRIVIFWATLAQFQLTSSQKNEKWLNLVLSDHYLENLPHNALKTWYMHLSYPQYLKDQGMWWFHIEAVFCIYQWRKGPGKGVMLASWYVPRSMCYHLVSTLCGSLSPKATPCVQDQQLFLDFILSVKDISVW